MSNKIGNKRKSAEIEVLEKRNLLAAFGTPWPDARSLTISFPEDGVGVGEYENNATESLSAVASQDQWQELALRAFQTWAIQADINIGLRNDYNLDFGATGFLQSDPRIGDFRIGAFPQTGLVASSVPYQAAAGTASGDLLLNSNQNFQYHDWANDLAPDPDSIGDLDRDLFSILLHESGNSLGLADNSSQSSVLFAQYTVPKGILTAEDVNAIQELYGERTDPYEQLENDQISVASVIPTPTGFNPAEDIITNRGSLRTGNDVDVYQITPVSGQDNLTIRLNAEGISLLNSRIEVIDAAGNVIDQAQSSSVFSNDVALEISGVEDHSILYIRVSASDPSDVYSVGDYELDLDYRSAAVRATDLSAGDYDSGPDTLFANFDLSDPELGVNDTPATATILSSLAGNSATRYEFESSVSGASDVDFFNVTAPSEINGPLRIELAGIGNDTADLRLAVVDASGGPVGTAGRLNPDGTWVLEVLQPEADAEYLIRVSVDPNSVVSLGNYVALAEFTQPSEQLNELVSGSVSSDLDDFYSWTAHETRLFRFDLATVGGEEGDLVKLTIYDAHTKERRLVINTPSDGTRSGLAWLQEGDYILRFTAVNRAGEPVTNIDYTTSVDGLSDDQSDQDDYDYDYEYDQEYEYHNGDENNYYPYDPYYDDTPYSYTPYFYCNAYCQYYYSYIYNYYY